MEINRLKRLIYKYQNGSCSPDELLELRELLNHSSHTEWMEEVYDQMPEGNSQVSDLLKEKVLLQIQNDSRIQQHKLRKPNRSWMYYSAAVILAFIGMACWFYFVRIGVIPNNVTPLAVVPGYDRALIELNDGRRFQLDSLSDATELKAKGFFLSKQDDKHILFKYNPDPAAKKSGSHTLTTPKGGQFKLELPDGTKIWMNAESTIQFASDFGTHTRDILCEGEVYFEVNKKTINGELTPFTVSTKGQHLTVVGTTFNVNSYNDEVVTTLVEGKVSLKDKYNRSILLNPDHQSIYNGDFRIQEADPMYAVAWKDGDFAFRKSSISEVMLSIARWYDVQVKYEGNFQEDVFSGTISRYEDIDKLLKTMELTGSFHFTREGRTIIVKK